MKTRRKGTDTFVYADSGESVTAQEDMNTYVPNGRGKSGTIVDHNGNKREIITWDAYKQRNNPTWKGKWKKLVYADSGIFVTEEDMTTFVPKTKGKGKGGTIVDHNGNTREIITKDAYHHRINPAHNAEDKKFVYADSGKLVTGIDQLTFSLEGNSGARGLGGTFTDEHGREIEIITKDAYRHRINYANNARQHQKAQPFVYADSGKLVTEIDQLTFSLEGNSSARGLGGTFTDENGREIEIITKHAYEQRNNLAYKDKKHRSEHKLVYAESGKFVTAQDLTTFMSKAKGHSRGGTIVDENGREIEIITISAYRRRINPVYNAKWKELVYADSGKLVTEKDMTTFVHKTKGYGTGGTIVDDNGNKKEIITKDAYRKRKNPTCKAKKITEMQKEKKSVPFDDEVKIRLRNAVMKAFEAVDQGQDPQQSTLSTSQFSLFQQTTVNMNQYSQDSHPQNLDINSLQNDTSIQNQGDDIDQWIDTVLNNQNIRF